MQVEKTEEFLGVIDLEEDGDTPDDQREDQSDPDVVRALRNVVHLLDDRPADVDPCQFNLLHLTALPDQTAHYQIKNTDTVKVQPLTIHCQIKNTDTCQINNTDNFLSKYKPLTVHCQIKNTDSILSKYNH